MSEPLERTRGTSPGVRRLIWWGFFLVWTGVLVAPMPNSGPWTVGDLELDFKYLLGKSLHVGAYAVMTALTGWLRPVPRVRVLLLFFLMAHATATELIQLHVAGRSGCLEDVAFDQLGIGIGLALSWRWWACSS